MLPINQILCGDCLEVMKDFPDESIDMVMFSPPYWGLRDYGVEGQIGLEEHPRVYVAHMVEVCREVKRVLKKHGSMYVVLGDTYCGSHSGYGDYRHANKRSISKTFLYNTVEKSQSKFKDKDGWLQPKQKLLIPSRVAIALQEEGWILRNDIVWHKPNHMPSSVKDRLSNAYEHVFFFVKARRYYYDLDAIRQPHTSVKDLGRKRLDTKTPKHDLAVKLGAGKIGPSGYLVQHPKGKNPGDVVLTKHDIAVWRFPTVNRQSGLGYTDPLHVKAYHKKGKNHGDVISERVKANLEHFMPRGSGGHYAYGGIDSEKSKHEHPKGKNPGDVLYSLDGRDLGTNVGEKGKVVDRKDQWRPQTRLLRLDGKNPGDFWSVNTKPFKGAHFAVYPEAICVKPILSSCPPNGTVLDPMCGSGTTCVVAQKLGRKWIGIELNPEYVEIAKKRLMQQSQKLEPFIQTKPQRSLLENAI